MKLLIITQAVDRSNPYLGFFHRWIEEFAKHCEVVTVIALGVGDYNLPNNVKVLSLGKESGQSRLKYIWRFYKYIWRERHGYDQVFVHMNPEYVVLGGLFWRLIQKKVSLWYTHKNVDLKLMIAEKFVDRIFSASPSGFQLPSKKAYFAGHGIDVDKWVCQNSRAKFSPLGSVKIVSVGRITQIKNLESLVKATAILKRRLPSNFILVDIVGGTVDHQDQSYREELVCQIRELGLKDNINFVGEIKPEHLASYYCNANLSVNLSPTGGMDKVVLESWATGCPALVANETFKDYLGEELAPLLFFNFGDEEDLARKMEWVLVNSNQDLEHSLINLVKNKSSLEVLISLLMDKMK